MMFCSNSPDKPPDGFSVLVSVWKQCLLVVLLKCTVICSQDLPKKKKEREKNSTVFLWSTVSVYRWRLYCLFLGLGNGRNIALWCLQLVALLCMHFQGFRLSFLLPSRAVIAVFYKVYEQIGFQKNKVFAPTCVFYNGVCFKR